MNKSKQIQIADYWNDGPPTKQWIPVIDRLIDTYISSAAMASRILASVHASVNDIFVIVMYLKYLWDIPRANQLDQTLATLECTPRHPSYPSGHAAVAGCIQEMLSCFFPPESLRLKELAEECALSRLYAGVHYPVDNSEGLKLGRQIGLIISNTLDKQKDSNQVKVDLRITENRHANLPPPPYDHAIPFKRSGKCGSKVIPRSVPKD